MACSIGASIAALCRQRGMSLETVARKAGIAPTTLRRWERDATRPRLVELQRVCKVLGVPRDEYLELLGMTPATPRTNRELLRQGGEEQELQRIWCPGPGELSRTLRARQGLSARDLAKAIRVHPSRVCRW